MARRAVRSMLITGGAGFIGSHLAAHFVARGVSVVVLDKLGYCASLGNLKALEGLPNYAFVHGDILDTENVAKCLAHHRIDTILHCAAHTHVDASFEDPLPFIVNNAAGTRSLMDAARIYGGLGLFCHVSTDEVYGAYDEGEHGAGGFTEAAEMRPTNPYSCSKANAERIVRECSRQHNIPAVVARCNNAYGPHQYPEKVVPKFILHLAQGRKWHAPPPPHHPFCPDCVCVFCGSPVHGRGDHFRSYMYVGDVVSAFDCIVRSGRLGETYNIGTPFETNTLGVVRSILELLPDDDTKKSSGDDKERVEHVADRPLNDRRYRVDASKLLALGWSPQVPWQKGLSETVRWYTHTMRHDHWTPTYPGVQPVQPVHPGVESAQPAQSRESVVPFYNCLCRSCPEPYLSRCSATQRSSALLHCSVGDWLLAFLCASLLAWLFKRLF